MKTDLCKVLFVHNEPTRFVIIDRNLLSEQCEVHDWYVRSKRVDLAATARAVRQADMVFCWFASWHSLFPVLFARMFRKPSLVVVGGYDTARVPEANYGSQRGGLKQVVSRATISNATHLVTNSLSAKREAVENAHADPNKISVVYHGVDTFPMGPLEGRPRIALTVGNVWRENLLRKGLLPFVQAARYLPDIQFIHAGKWSDDSIQDLRAMAGPNVKFAGFLPDLELQSLVQHAWVYVQASLHEGFGMSLAEAMSAGCIPVSTANCALPEVVGDTGVYASSNAPADVASAIRQAFERDGEARCLPRERVLSEFSMERRRWALHQLTSQLAARTQVVYNPQMFSQTSG